MPTTAGSSRVARVAGIVLIVIGAVLLGYGLLTDTEERNSVGIYAAGAVCAALGAILGATASTKRRNRPT